MKLKQTLLSLCGIAMLWALTTNLHAQVTIGSSTPPAPGALLDLKQDGIFSNNATANKGLGLPRVALTDVSKLYPMFPIGYNANENAAHTGLVVYHYNTTDANCKLDPIWNGVHVWTGNNWNNISRPNGNASRVGSFVDDRDGEIYHYSQFGTAGTWMTENLRATKYPATASSPISMDMTFGSAGSGVDNIYDERVVYPNQITGANHTIKPDDWVSRNGVLYNYAGATVGWFSYPEVDATDMSNNAAQRKTQGICPSGWYLPSDYEWNLLEQEIATHPELYSIDNETTTWSPAYNTAPGYRPTTTTNNKGQGRSMLSQCPAYPLPSGTTPLSPFSLHSVEGGFNATLSGWADDVGKGAAGAYSVFWASSTSSIRGNAYHRRLDIAAPGIYRSLASKLHYFSVRCKMNEKCTTDKTNFRLTEPNDPNSIGILTDHEGKEYFTATFGTAGRWMTQNLSTTSYPISNMGNCQTVNIPFWNYTGNPADPAEVMTYLRTHDLIAYPNGSTTTTSVAPSTWEQEQGVLYTHKAATAGYYAESNADFANRQDEMKHQGVCPTGWHIPTDYEFNQLEEELATNARLYIDMAQSGSAASTIWKDAYHTTDQYRPNNTDANVNPATDTQKLKGHGQVMRAKNQPFTTAATPFYIGFSKSASQGGFADLLVGWFGEAAREVGQYGVFHCSSPRGLLGVAHRRTDSQAVGVTRFAGGKGHMFSIRCVQD